MYFIQHIESITHQDSFQKENLWPLLKRLNAEDSLVSPDFKEFIPVAALRRLSTILRMGIAASQVCQKQVPLEFDAISVGTALGCLTDTEKFLVTINTVSGDILSPTAFIQSTHNTISGQISLDLKNHAYNMTHTQNALSFEVALIDGMLSVDEGKKSVLVGAADEAIPFLDRLRGTVIQTTLPFTSGATFGVLSSVKQHSIAHVQACEVSWNTSNLKQQVKLFLEKQQLSFASLDLILEAKEQLRAVGPLHYCYSDFSGFYQTASAFGLHLAHDWMVEEPVAKKVLVVNNLEDGKLGLTLVSRNEA